MKDESLPKVPALERHGQKIILALAVLYSVFFISVSVIRYNFFDFSDFDLAIYSQVMWNLLHGSTFSSILGISFLGNHTDIVLFLLLPFYMVIKTPLFLLAVQTIAVSSTAYLLYGFTSRLLNNTWAVLLAVIYFIYPPLVYSNLFEFHPVVLAIPFLTLAFLAYIDGKMPLFAVYSVLAMLCKESVPLIIIMFGILAIVDKRPVRWAVMPIILGGFFFILLVFYIKPYFNKGVMNFFILYGGFGSPLKTAKALFSAQNLGFLLNIFVSAAFLPFFAARQLIPAVLVFLQHLLSFRGSEKLITYHYAAELVPFVFISAAYGLKRVLNTRFIQGLGNAAVPFLTFFILGISVFINTAVSRPVLDIIDKIPSIIKDGQGRAIKQKYIDLVPRDASVISTFAFLPKLSQRERLYSYHHIHRGYYTFSDKTYPLPRDPGYCLMDFNDEMAFDDRGMPGCYDNMKRFFDHYNWQVIDSDGSLVLFKNSGRKDLTGLFKILDTAPDVGISVNGTVNDEIELIGFDSIPGQGDKEGEVLFSFYWKCLKEPASDYNSYLRLISDSGSIIKITKKYTCYRIYPTMKWKPGDIIREDYWYAIPSGLENRNYCVELIMVDDGKKALVPIRSDRKELFDIYGELMVLKIKQIHP